MRMRNLKSNVFAFGYNGQAQLGQGHTANRDTPQRVFGQIFIKLNFFFRSNVISINFNLYI